MQLQRQPLMHNSTCKDCTVFFMDLPVTFPCSKSSQLHSQLVEFMTLFDVYMRNDAHDLCQVPDWQCSWFNRQGQWAIIVMLLQLR